MSPPETLTGPECGDGGGSHRGEVNDLSRMLEQGSAPEMIGELSDQQLALLLECANQELRQRAITQGDLGAVIDEAFEIGFDSAGMAKAPYRRGLLVVCPGSKVGSSAMSHKCRFVSVSGTWVWEAGELVTDEIRPRDRHSTASVSLIVATEGTELEVITSRFRGGSHERTAAEAYRVEGDSLVALGKRAGRVVEHR